MPPRLYKYQPFALQTLLNLKKQVVYFGSPKGFNDPYDCGTPPRIEPIADSDVLQLRDDYLEAERVSPELRAKFGALPIEELRQLLHKAGRIGIAAIIDKFNSAHGITCFAERKDDLLMWSHYGGSYKGFCLEFDTSSPLFAKAQKVRYLRDPVTVSLGNILLNREIHVFHDLFCTKSVSWRYEEEWRAMHVNVGTEFVYPSDALTGIYFGPEMLEEAIEICCLVLRGQNRNVKLWRGQRSTDEFKVNFSEFTYSTHLESKLKDNA